MMQVGKSYFGCWPRFLFLFALTFLPILSWATDRQITLDKSCGYEQFVSLQLNQQCLLNHADKNACLKLGLFNLFNGKSNKVPEKAIRSLLNNLSEEMKAKLTKAIDAAIKIQSETAFQPKGNYYSTGSFSIEMARYNDRMSSAFHEELKAIFPDEFKALDAIEKERLAADSEIRARHDRKYRTYSTEVRYTSWGGRVWQEYREQANTVEAEAWQKKKDLIAKNPRVGLVDLLDGTFRTVQSVPTGQQIYDLLVKLVEAEKDEQKRAELIRKVQFIDDVYPIEPKSSVSSYPKWQQVKEAIGGKTGLMINFGIPAAAFAALGFSDYTMARTQLNNCAGTYDLSEKELAYLKDGPYLGVKAKSLGGCDSVRFVTQPVDEFKNLVQTFGGVPAGICKIVKNQAEYFNRMLDSGGPVVSCSSSVIRGNDFSLDLDGREVTIHDSGTDYVFPWNKEENFPALGNVRVLRSTSVAPKLAQQEFQKMYAERILKAGTKDETITMSVEQDILSPCEKGTYCSVRGKAIAAKVTKAQADALCPMVQSRAAAAGSGFLQTK